jgi:hypothetical protein
MTKKRDHWNNTIPVLFSFAALAGITTIIACHPYSKSRPEPEPTPVQTRAEWENARRTLVGPDLNGDGIKDMIHYDGEHLLFQEGYEDGSFAFGEPLEHAYSEDGFQLKYSHPLPAGSISNGDDNPVIDQN